MRSLKISPLTFKKRPTLVKLFLCVIKLEMPSGKNLRRRRDSSEDEEDDIAEDLR